MKKTTFLYVAIVSAALALTACTRDNTATERSPDMGAENAEGGTTPHVTSMQDSLAKNRPGNTDENSGVSRPVESNTASSGEGH